MKVALTGGGTLGHIIPALTVASKVKELNKDTSFIFIGSKKRSEREYVERRGITFYPITTGKLRRYFTFKNLLDVFKVIKGFFDALDILKREKPDVVFSKGGFVSVPVVVAAHLLKIRTITHESDYSMGLANRINSLFCTKVALSFDSKRVDNKKYFYTSNPIRDDLLKCDNSGDYILFLGGSKGSREINELVYSNLDELLKLGKVYHQAGESIDRSIIRDNYTQVEFINDDYPNVLKHAHLVISRSGANALFELLYVNVPLLLIPLSTKKSRGDQIENAAWAERNGCARVLRDNDDFISIVKELLYNEEVRYNMKSKSEKFNIIDGSLSLSRMILNEE